MVSVSVKMVLTGVMLSQLAFKWFDSGMADLEMETQIQLFQTRVLKV